MDYTNKWLPLPTCNKNSIIEAAHLRRFIHLYQNQIRYGKTKTAVFQEFYINLLMSNLTSLIKNKVDDDIDEHMTTTGKYRYQANRAYIIGRLKKAFPKILCNILQTEYIDQIVSDAFKVRSQIIPGRKFRRKTRKLVCRKHYPNLRPVNWYIIYEFFLDLIWFRSVCRAITLRRKHSCLFNMI